MAYIARYGCQRVPDILAMTANDAESLYEALRWIVEVENKGGKG